MQEDFLIQIDRRVQGALQRRISPIDGWRRVQLKAIDGTSVTLLDPQENQDLSPQHSSQKEGYGHPLMAMAGMTNLSHVGIEGFETCPARKHDSVIVPRLLKHIHADDLYMERWQIELKFRDLKTTLGMEHLAVKTPEMARKRIIMMQIAYNLLRVVMQRSAREAGKPGSAKSVKGALDCLTSSHESFRSVAGKPRLRKELSAQLIADCSRHVLAERPYRQEPRAVKRRPKTYQYLTSHRHTFKEIYHRESYRLPA